MQISRVLKGVVIELVLCRNLKRSKQNRTKIDMPLKIEALGST
jgi:hypothetical protein